MKKTGETARQILAAAALHMAIGAAFALAPFSLAGVRVASAEEGPKIEFSAKVDRNQVSLDESVALKLTVQSEGSLSIGGGHLGAPQFTAPDFDVVNEYSGTQVESYYDGTTGRFGMRNNQQLTKVLRPKHTGTLRIGRIQIRAGDKTLTAPDITVQVLAAGGATQPPLGYGGAGVGLRGAGKRTNAGPSVKVRAEVDKDKVYKGEQIIVSYYLYRRVRVFNISVDKFPVLNGFLREDLEMPVISQRLETERVMLDGVPYERSLLIKYAAYPLQTGKLKVDSAALKYQYYANTSTDEEDPFMGFFRQMTPMQGNDRSEILNIDVLPLPDEGKPNSFTGGVGDFSVTSAVDKYEVRANEAVTLTLKVEGRGNLAAIGEPKAKWPDSVELYDSKGAAKSGRLGVGEKVFEYLLIPRAPGKVTLPALEFSFFDPIRKEYVVRATAPVEITVTDPAPGSPAYHPPKAPNAATSTGGEGDGASKTDADPKAQLQGLKTTDAAPSEPAIPVWRWIYWLCTLAAAALVGLVVFDFLRKAKSRSSAEAEKKAKTQARSWQSLREKAARATQGAPWNDVLQTYETLAGVMFDALDQAYAIRARTRPRSELRELLVVQQGLNAKAWEKISNTLEFAETVRFATSAGAVSEQAARTELARWVNEAETAVRDLKP
jgi:hypothetical protein